ncbi:MULTISPECIES: effector-associated constant component EACC1 [Kitasatospora]|uniref:effector-associated constant component EACC1 n=1 Tax=Kitasatospora TaxID=2063 RepID=UPI000C71319C|nr:hypothetical protein [Kitasatospora sp. GP30]MDH6143427.1 hypothetical protein [Kitasatospora sp. GP30]
MVTIELRVSDPAELRALRTLLVRMPGLEVVQQAGAPVQGELGVWDFLQVAAASGGVLAAAVGTIPEFIRSRRTDVTVTIKREDLEVEVNASNAEDALRLVDKALNG